MKKIKMMFLVLLMAIVVGGTINMSVEPVYAKNIFKKAYDGAK